MKKVLCVVLIALAALCLLVVALFLPPVTTMLANSVAAPYFDEFHADHVSIGFGGVTAKGVRFALPGVKGRVASLEFSGSTWAAAMNQSIDASLLRMIDADVTLVSAAGAPSASAAAKVAELPRAGAVFGGVIPLADVGVKLRSIAKLEATGKVTIEGGAKIDFAAAAENLTAGKDGVITVRVNLAEPASGVTASTTGQLTLGFDAAGVVRSVGWSGEHLFEGAGSAEKMKMTSTAALTAESAGGEHYEALVTEPGRPEDRPVLRLTADFDTSAGRCTGQLHYAVDSECAFVRAAMKERPDLDLRGETKFDVDFAKNVLTVSNQAHGNGSRWNRLLRELTPMTAIRLESEFAAVVSLATNEVQLDRLHVVLSDVEARRPVLTLECRQPFTIDARASLGLIPVALRGDSDLRLELHGLPLKWVSSFFDGVTYTSDNLTGAFQVTHTGGVVKLTATSPLAVANFSLTEGKQALLRDVRLTLAPVITYRPADSLLVIEQTRLGVGTRTGEVCALTGEVRLALNGAEIKRLDADLQLAVDARAVLDQPVLRDLKVSLPGTLGRLDAKAVFSLDQRDERTVVAAFKTVDARVGDGKGQDCLRIELLQPTDLRVVDGVLQPPAVEGELARVVINGLDYVWAEKFLPGWKLQGKGLTGEFAVVSEAGAVELKVKRPIVAAGFALSGPDGRMGAPLNISFDPRALARGGRLNAGWGALRVDSGGESLVQFAADAEMRMAETDQAQSWGTVPPTSFRTSLTSSLAAWSRQPALAGMPKMTKGALEFTAEGDVRRDGSARTVLALKGLEFASAPASLLEGEFELDAKLGEAGAMQLDGRANLGAANRPALLAAEWRGRMQTEDKGQVFALEMRADRFDLVQLLDLMNSTAEPTPAELATPVADKAAGAPAEKKGFFSGLIEKVLPKKGEDAATKADMKTAVVSAPVPPDATWLSRPYDRAPDKAPFWTGYRGKAEIDARESFLPGAMAVQDLRATFNMDPRFLSLGKMNLRVREAPAEVSCQLDFAEGSTPYHLHGRMTLTDFNLGSYIREQMPFWGQMFSGDVKMLATWDTRAPNAEVLMRSLQGTLEMESNHGEVNPLGLGGQAVAKTVNAALTGASLTSFLTKGDTREKIDAVRRVLQVLNGFTYDEFRLRGTRGRDLRLKIEEFIFRNPEIILRGEGYATLTEDMRYMDQPMDLTLRFFVKGDTEMVFTKAKLVRSTARDELGYAQGPIIRLRGTPLTPDWSDLVNILMQSVAAK